MWRYLILALPWQEAYQLESYPLIYTVFYMLHHHVLALPWQQAD